MTTFPDITPKSAERKKLALRHLGRDQTFATLDIAEDNPAEAEPLEIEATRVFETDIDNYYHFPIDYTPYFDRHWNLLSPSKWLYFIDINDEVIEKKFPRDQDMRSIITAFRYSIIRNRRHIIALKRMTQALGIVALLVPALLLAYMPALAKPAIAAGLAGGAALIAILFAAYQYMRDSQLKSVLERNGRTLASKIQDRANDLNRHFLEFFARIDREELNDNIVDPEWTHRSAWWMKLCMWYPRRIESIEMFLQSEMQRTRIYMLRSAWMGYISAFLLILTIPAAALLLISLKAPLGGSGSALTWMLWLFGTVASGFLTLYSIRTSMSLKRISEAVGKEPLGHQSRFADIDLHNKLAGQIRRDKEGLRQAQLRGGYGERRSG